MSQIFPYLQQLFLPCPPSSAIQYLPFNMWRPRSGFSFGQTTTAVARRMVALILHTDGPIAGQWTELGTLSWNILNTYTNISPKQIKE